MRSARQSCRALTAAILISALSAFAASPQHASSTVVVTTGDAQTNVLLSGVEIQLAPIGRAGTSDIVGEAIFRDVPAGKYHVSARRLGFEPLSADIMCVGADTVRVTLLMGAAARVLDTQHVEARGTPNFLQEFDGRRTLGLGHYMTELALDSVAGRDLATELAVRFPGVRAVAGKYGTQARYLASSRGSPSLGSSVCLATVYLDRIRVADGDISHIRPETLAGAEYYSESTTPAQYRTGAPCGVLLLWSRH